MPCVLLSGFYHCYNQCIQHVIFFLQGNTNEPVWLMNSIHLDLVNVVVHLKQTHGEGIPLACINFIKSRLVVETFSDRSQDIDLVSAEILITDTRFTGLFF